MIKCFVGVCIISTVSYLDDNKRRVLGAKKQRENLAVHELYEDLPKKNIGGDISLV